MELWRFRDFRCPISLSSSVRWPCTGGNAGKVGPASHRMRSESFLRGLCGEIQFDGSIPNLTTTQRMTDALAPRGPDAAGFFAQGSVALGHRRLSILDLTATGQQPMFDATLGLAVAFNGCIYNFRDLRRTLQEKGYRFFSECDTEVILKAYHAWGPRCVERFLGMFAFAIWERDSGRVVLARDRLGIKPLYLAETPGGLRFASTLPALLAAGGVDTTIDRQALHHYMSFHAVVPAPLTILRGVRKLPPATVLTIAPDGTRREESYWTLTVGARREDRAMTADDWREAVLESLKTAVDRRRVADVPVGVLLSGGLDSSLVVALLAEGGHAAGLKTFSIGFDSVGDAAGDEFRYSDLIATQFATDHYRIRIDPTRALSSLPGAIASMSEPMMSHDAIGFYLLSEVVARHVKVVQSGQGADEIFAGYHWYPPMMRTNDPVGQYADVYFDRDHDEMREALAPRLMNGDYSREFVDSFFARAGGARPIDNALTLDTQIMLVDDPVKRVDN